MRSKRSSLVVGAGAAMLNRIGPWLGSSAMLLGKFLGQPEQRLVVVCAVSHEKCSKRLRGGMAGLMVGG